MEIELTAENFEAEVINANLLVIVQFRASWDNACASFSPVFSHMAEKYSDGIVFGKVNIDNEIILTTKYGITSVPTLIVFENGNETARNVGFLTDDEFDAFIIKHNRPTE